MAVVKIETREEMSAIVTYLADCNSVPGDLTNEERRRFLRKAVCFELHDTRLYFKKPGNVLLRFFGEYEREEKLNAIEERHKELACVRRDKLLFDLRTRIYNARRDEVEEALNRCTACMFRRRLTTTRPSRAIVASRVAERYQADLIDIRHYSAANDGYCWILNVLDVYSKYLMSIPLKNKTSEVVKTGFVQVFEVFGEPAELQTDNGREFKNRMLTDYLTSLNVRRVYGRARHPQTNGQVERCNQTLKRLVGNLIGHVSGPDARWIDAHAKAVSIYNRTMHREHGETPFRVFYNRVPGNVPVPPQVTEVVEESDEIESTDLIEEDPLAAVQFEPV